MNVRLAALAIVVLILMLALVIALTFAEPEQAGRAQAWAIFWRP